MHVFGAQSSDEEQFEPDTTQSSERKKPKMASFDRIVALCAVRDRSYRELQQRLERDGYEAEDIQQSLERACSCGLVDDMRFAQAFIRGRVSAGKGEAVIRRDLEKHGIEADAVPGWPTDFNLDSTSQVDAAVALLEAHPPRAKDLYSAAYRRLITKGYPKSVASRAVRQWFEARS